MVDSVKQTQTNKEIIENNENYFKHFPTDNSDQKEYNNILKAFEIAIRTREFEIELYWKRANYFWLFVSVIFIGWYNVSCTKDDTSESILIQFLLVWVGFSVSFCWYCVNRGSKYWQENWESNIKYLSSKLKTPIFGMIAYHQDSAWKPIKRFPYSVSKINQLVSLIITVFWVLIGVSQIFDIVRDGGCTCCIILFYVVYVLVLFGTIWFIHTQAKSFVCNEIKKGEVDKVSHDAVFFNYDPNIIE